jgi:hypothetical protein
MYVYIYILDTHVYLALGLGFMISGSGPKATHELLYLCVHVCNTYIYMYVLQY